MHSLVRWAAFAALPALLLAACNNSADKSRGTTASEPQAESPAEAPKPEALAPNATGLTPSDVQGVPLKPDESNQTTANPPYLGIWAADPDWCANSSGDNVPIEITPTQFKGYENSCTFASLTDKGNGTWDADLSCAGRGEQSQRRITLRVAANDLEVVYHNLDDQTVSYTRCVPDTGK